MIKLNSNRKFILIVISALLLVGGVWVFVLWGPTSENKVPSRVWKSDAATADSLWGQGGNVAGQKFEREETDFTFQYPQKYMITVTPYEGGGQNILVESAQARKGFEMNVLPFDENVALTPERIRQDLPDMPIEELQYLIFSPVSGGEIPALSFNSQDENIGKTYEIWFASHGYIYQAVTYPEFATQMQEILGTWAFK